MAAAPDEGDEDGADEQREGEQDDVDGDGVVGEELVGCGVEGGLREVEEAGEADDEAVDFAEGGEAEDFGGVVAGLGVSYMCVDGWIKGDLRDGGVV